MGKRWRRPVREMRRLSAVVTEGPGTSTKIFVKVTPGPIQVAGLEVPRGACIREVPKKTAGVRLQSAISAGSKSTKPNLHPTTL